MSHGTKVRMSPRQRANQLRFQCGSGKAAYPNKATARSEGARISKWRTAQGLVPLSVYRCPHCDRFHLTSKGTR